MTLATIALAALALGGCGRSESGDITISSTPGGADVYVDGDYVGVTPVTVHMYADHGTDVLLRLAGYLDARLQLAVSTYDEGHSGHGGPTVIVGAHVHDAEDAWILLFTSTTTTTSELSTRANDQVTRFDKYDYHVTMTPANAQSSVIEQRQRVVNYVLANFPELQVESAVGEGTYLTGLVALLGEQRRMTTAELAEVVRANGTAPTCASAVAAL